MNEPSQIAREAAERHKGGVVYQKWQIAAIIQSAIDRALAAQAGDLCRIASALSLDASATVDDVLQKADALTAQAEQISEWQESNAGLRRAKINLETTLLNQRDELAAKDKAAETLAKELNRKTELLDGVIKELGISPDIISAPCDALPHYVRDLIRNSNRFYTDLVAAVERVKAQAEQIAALKDCKCEGTNSPACGECLECYRRTAENLLHLSNQHHAEIEALNGMLSNEATKLRLAGRSCDELREQITAKDKEIERLNAAVESVCKGSFDASEALAKDNADLRTQLDKANAAAGEAKAAYVAEIKSHARTEQQRTSLLRDLEQLRVRLADAKHDVARLDWLNGGNTGFNHELFDRLTVLANSHSRTGLAARALIDYAMDQDAALHPTSKEKP